MTDFKTEYEFDQEIRNHAKEIAERAAAESCSIYDTCAEYAESSEHVIYHANSAHIAAKFNTDRAHELIDDCGGPQIVDSDGSLSVYNKVCQRIAYNEILSRLIEYTNDAVENLNQKLLDELEVLQESGENPEREQELRDKIDNLSEWVY